MSERARGRWITYLRERSPLPLLLVIALGQSLSGNYLVRGGFSAWVGAAAVGIAALLVLMRLMDEIKDLDKDRVAHPGRPLPRGLLAPGEVRRATAGMGVALVGYAALLAAAGRPAAGALYALTVGYAFLMYREFFAARALGRNAFVYAATHQVIVVPMYLFAVACASPSDALSARALWFGLTGLSASFIVEVCRKLDPAAHPVLGTYLRTHGRGAVLAAVGLALALLAASTLRIGVHTLVWPFGALFALTLPLLYLRPGRFRTIEGAAALLALVQMLAPTLRHAWSALV